MKDRIAINSKAENFTKSRLPAFTKTEIDFIRGTSDFFGLNHYSSGLVSDVVLPADDSISYEKDVSVSTEFGHDWKGSASPWLFDVPWGFRKLLNWIKREYNNPMIFVTENGYADLGELQDDSRIEYVNV